MARFRGTVSYNGTPFAGWQVQPGQLTIQGLLESALNTILGDCSRVTGSGRTDAGVHAVGQVFAFDGESRLAAADLQRAINANTPNEVCVRDLHETHADFHPIRDAISKQYRYVINHGSVIDVFSQDRCWHIYQPLNLSAMQQAAEFLKGTHDFASFEAAGSDRKTSVRSISQLELIESCENDVNMITIYVRADGFLYNMVRNIVGTLVEVGKGKREPSWVVDVQKKCDRQCAGPTAPPDGLCLMDVEYES